MDTPIKKRAALYIRVSTEEQARHGYSLGEQEHDLRQHAEQHGYIVVGVYADEGISARKALSRRKALQRLLNDVRTGVVNIIVFKCLDRWFRNVRDYYAVQDILDQHGVLWECSQEEIFNTTTTNGRLMLNLKLSLAQHESDQTGDRVRYIFEGRRRIGKVTSGSIPDGYLINDDKRIQIDKDVAPMVRAMFRHFIASRNILHTYRMLREKYDYKKSDSAVGRALRNRLYIGEYHGIKGFCPALISKNTFAQAQEILAGHTKHPHSSNIYVYTGLLRCPNCGRALTPAFSRSKDKVYIYYICRNATHSDCTYKTYYPEQRIESILLDALEREIQKHQNIKGSENLLIEQERLKEQYVSKKIYRENFDAEYNRLHAQIADMPPSKNISLAYIKLLLIDNFRGYYMRLDKAAQKLFWNHILERVDICGDTLTPIFIKI